jgi:hypothetical protein
MKILNHLLLYDISCGKGGGGDYTNTDAYSICKYYRIIFISGFHRDVDEICALLGYYVVLCGNCLPTFWDNIAVPSSRVKSPRRKDK